MKDRFKIYFFNFLLLQISNERGFENVELGVMGKKKKVLRRVIYFVSGEIMEEYSIDEDEVDGLDKKDVLFIVDSVCLAFVIWFVWVCF